MTSWNKGNSGTIDNPGANKKVRWVRDVALAWDSDECLPFPFPRNPTGYARMWHDGANIYAHQFVCTLTHGPRPSPRHDAAHSCGNGHEGCVNRRHLSWKTKSENQKEGWQQGRRGKLTAEQAAAIRLDTRAPHVIAAEYGVNERNVRKIQSGKGWTGGTRGFKPGDPRNPLRAENRAVPSAQCE